LTGEVTDFYNLLRRVGKEGTGGPLFRVHFLRGDRATTTGPSPPKTSVATSELIAVLTDPRTEERQGDHAKMLTRWN
jgi:hypothetical protein